MPSGQISEAEKLTEIELNLANLSCQVGVLFSRYGLASLESPKLARFTSISINFSASLIFVPLFIQGGPSGSGQVFVDIGIRIALYFQKFILRRTFN